MQYVLSVEAEEDVVRIAEHGVRNFGVAHARRYHDELFDALDLIARHPLMTRERNEITPPVRIHPFKAHLIIYRVDENGAIFVIRIRHGHEDWAGIDN